MLSLDSRLVVFDMLYTNRYITSLGKLVKSPPENGGEPLRMCQFDTIARPTFLLRTL